MKRFLRISSRVLLVVVLAVIGVFCYLKLYLPRAGKVEVFTVESTTETIERGKYLANHVTVCVDCHSQRDWSIYSGPIKPGTFGMGGEYFGRNLGLPGDFYARNITPHNLKDWTDGEIYHLITTGINKDGEAIFPVMPYQAYAQMDPEDVKAIIAYIRTLEPIKNEIPKRSIDFPMNLILNTIPKKAEPKKRPSKSDHYAYGKYMTTIAGCIDCHTKAEKGKMVEGMEFAGGFEFAMPGGTLRSSNITPHKSGIENWTKKLFIDRFKSYADTSRLLRGLNEKDFNTIMPWTMYSGMTEEDLGAIYDYLRTLKPIDNSVVRYTKK